MYCMYPNAHTGEKTVDSPNMMSSVAAILKTAAKVKDPQSSLGTKRNILIFLAQLLKNGEKGNL